MFKRFTTYALIIIFLGCSSKNGIVLDEESPESLLQKAEVAYENGNYDETTKINQMLLDNFPTSDLHIDAQLLNAKTLGKKEQFEDQFDLLLRILKENIIPEKVPLIFLQIGEYYERAATWNPGNITSDTLDLRQAATYYRRAVFYPNSDDRMTKAHALYRAALMHAKINDFESAKNAYTQVIEVYPESPYSGLAKQKLLDPTNTQEIYPAPVIAGEEEAPAETPVFEETVTETPVAEEEYIPPIAPEEEPEYIPGISPDTTGFELPPDDLDQPILFDTTQTIFPDSL